MDVRFFEPGVFFLKGNLAAGFITAGGCTASIASAGGRLLGFAEQFRLGLGHGQINLSATLALRRNRTLRVRPAVSTKKAPQREPFVLTAGVEPTTRCLEGSCSIQLSYASEPLYKVAQI